MRFEGATVPVERGRHRRLRAVPRRRSHVLALAEVPPAARPVLRDRRVPELPRHGRRRSGRARRASPGARAACGSSARGWPVGRARPAARRRLAAPAACRSGFYYKTFIRPRFAWRMAERVIRRATGSGRCPRTRRPTRGRLEARPLRRARGRRRHRRSVGRARGRGGRRTRAAVRRVRDRRPRRTGSDARRDPGARGARPVDPGRSRSSKVTRRSACSTARCVPLARPGRARPGAPAERVVVATGAAEAHRSSPATTCPGVCSGARRPRWRRCTASRRAGAWWSSRHRGGRGAPAGAGRGRDAGSSPRSCRRRSWTRCRARPRRSCDGELVEARRARASALGGRPRARRAGARSACDALVLSMGLAPRDELARMAAGRTRRGRRRRGARSADEPRSGAAATVCLCEDVVAARPRAGLGRGVPLRRDPEAVHDRDDGPVPGRDVRSARWRASRATTRTRPTGVGSAHGRRRAHPRGRSPWRRSPAPVHEVIEKRTSLHDVARRPRARRSDGPAAGSGRFATATGARSTARCANASA